MKRCFKCDTIKPVDDFYRHPRMADGRLNKCKECAKADVKTRRSEAVDYYRAYDRARADEPKRVEARRAYRERKPAAGKDARGRWEAQNAHKRRAHVLVHRALASGELVVRPCDRCGYGVGLQAHHEDYAKPLDVTWLCPPCHGLRHREINEERRRAG